MVNTYGLNPRPYKCVATILRFQRTTWEAGDRKGIPHFNALRTNHCPESTSTLLTPEPDRTVLIHHKDCLFDTICLIDFPLFGCRNHLFRKERNYRPTEASKKN
ncbi:hypothetical protein V6N13_102206 [Hibiscus sabdariffa]